MTGGEGYALAMLESVASRPARLCIAGAVLAGVLLLTACGSDSESSSPSTTSAPTTTTTAAGPVLNACPVDGCRVTIDTVERAGDELKVTWTANFEPDFSRNHIHVYWDIFTADQVSDDAADRGVTQGSWHPTDAYPTYTTQSEASVARRGTSATLCVTAGDRNHIVIDSKLFDCYDAKDLL